MKRTIGMVGMALAAFAAHSAPLVGKGVGMAVERAVAREVGEEAAKRSFAAGSKGTMSAALAKVTAKQLMGTGVLSATPIAAYNLSAGPREVDEARAEVIRTAGAAVAKEIPNRPELAAAILTAVDGGGGSPLTRVKRWFDQTLQWVCGAVALVCLLFLTGPLLNGIACTRRGIAALAAVRRHHDGGGEPVAIGRGQENV